MFRLRKIIGGRTNVPEIQSTPIHTESSHKENALEYLVNGMLYTVNIEGRGTRYICLENCNTQTKNRAAAYKITPDMVFEADFLGNHDALLVGGKYALDANGNVTNTAGDDVILLDAREAASKGTVMVSFI